MIDKFSSWYVSVDKSGSPERREARIKALKELLTDDKVSLAGLVKAACGQSNESEKFAERIKAAFVKHDEYFTFQEKSLEVSVLASSVIYGRLTDKTCSSSLADECALLVLIAKSHIQFSGPMLEVVEAAKTYLDKRAVDIRKLKALESEADFAKKSKAIEAHFPNNALSSAGPEILKLLKALKSETSVLKDSLLVVQEENQFLWWMTTGYLMNMSKPLTDYPIEAALVYAFDEFSDMSNEGILPRRSSEILKNAILGRFKDVPQRVGLSVTIPKIEKSWLGDVIKSYEEMDSEVLALCPILSTLVQSWKFAEATQSDKLSMPVKSPFAEFELGFDEFITHALLEFSIVMHS